MRLLAFNFALVILLVLFSLLFSFQSQEDRVLALLYVLLPIGIWLRFGFWPFHRTFGGITAWIWRDKEPDKSV
jgi:hypothetical protein